MGQIRAACQAVVLHEAVRERLVAVVVHGPCIGVVPHLVLTQACMLMVQVGRVMTHPG